MVSRENVVQSIYHDLKHHAVSNPDADIREIHAIHTVEAFPRVRYSFSIVLPYQHLSKQFILCMCHEDDELFREPKLDIVIDGDIRFDHSMSLARTAIPDYLENPVPLLPLRTQLPCWQLPFRALQRVTDIFSVPLNRRQSEVLNGPDGLTIRTIGAAVDVFTRDTYPPPIMEDIPGLVHYSFRIDQDRVCLRGRNLRFPNRPDCIITMSDILQRFGHSAIYGDGFSLGGQGGVFSINNANGALYNMNANSRVARDAAQHLEGTERPESGVFTDSNRPSDYKKTGKTVGVDDLDDLFDKIDKDLEENTIEEE